MNYITVRFKWNLCLAIIVSDYDYRLIQFFFFSIEFLCCAKRLFRIPPIECLHCEANWFQSLHLTGTDVVMIETSAEQGLEPWKGVQICKMCLKITVKGNLIKEMTI